jgi:hypothetical protein
MVMGLGAIGIQGTLVPFGGTTASTFPLPSGVTLVTLHVFAASGGSVQLPGLNGGTGATITLPSGVWWVYQPLHSLFTVGPGAANITFSGVTSFFGEYVKAGNF